VRGPRAWVCGTLAFLRGQPAALLLVAAAGAAGAASGVPTGGVVFDYLWRDPQFCGTCHVHDYANEAWARSPHAALTTCHDCHRVPIRHYPHNLWLAVFDRPQTPEDVRSADVATVLCEQCHAEGGEHEALSGPMPDELRVAVPKVDGSPLHRLHLDAPDRRPPRYHGGDPADPVAPGPIVCLDCHGGQDLEVHTFTATARDCAACHRGLDPTDERGAALSCLDCHAAGFVGAPLP
jgi:hypothetical protein